jgi:post-segregation antitoxin (ccd killing protein)
MISQMPARPPFVIFEERSEEDRAETIKQGRLTMKAVNYAVIRQIGSKDTVEKEAEVWLNDNDKAAARGTFPAEWAGAFRKKYDEWKSGKEAPPNGFPLKEWAGISRAQAENCVQIGICTVEDLAGMNEPAMIQVGMGARVLKDKAQAWLDSRLTHGNAEQLAALRAEAADKDLRIKQLEEQLKNLGSRLDQVESRSPDGKRKAG